MRKLATFAIYTLCILLIGRNLTFLPRINALINTYSTSESLREKVLALTKKEKGSFSVYFEDLRNKSEVKPFGINEQQLHTAASVNKVPIIAVLYNEASRGEINLDDKVVLQEDDIEDYGTGSLRYSEPGGVYSLKTLAKLALQQSDNTAAKVLAQKVGTNTIQKTIAGWGLTQTHIENNKTTPFDMGLLFKKIYRGEVTSPALTKELLGFMTNTDFEDRLPKDLPKDTIVYHKTGDSIGGVHDVGIIRRGEQVFFVGVLTSDIGDKEQETKNIIGSIAHEVLSFLENRSY